MQWFVVLLLCAILVISVLHLAHYTIALNKNNEHNSTSHTEIQIPQTNMNTMKNNMNPFQGTVDRLSNRLEKALKHLEQQAEDVDESSHKMSPLSL